MANQDEFKLPANPSVQVAIEQCDALFQRCGLVFGQGTDNSWDEAVWLVLAMTGLPDEQDSLGEQLSALQCEKVTELAKRRTEERVPLAYLLGECEFATVPLYCQPGVIVPRSPLAELLQLQVKPWLAQSPKQILDMCCGGGCLGILAALVFPQSQVTLVDLDPAALALARANVDRHQLADRVRILESNLLAAVDPHQNWDLVLCNPPYVDQADMSSLPPEFQAEPSLALAGGEDGLDIMAPFLTQVLPRLTDAGVLLGEVGNSARALHQRFVDLDFIWPDLENGGEGVFVLLNPSS